MGRNHTQYDGLGRRETNSAGLSSQHDGSAMIGWSETGASYSFLTLPGGGTLAGAFTANGTTTTWVPIVDAPGSTIALVNAASTQSPATTYTYDPSGTPTLNGATNLWPFLYKGMEQETIDAPYYYTGSGQFFSPQMVRSLSEAGQTSSSGPGGGPGGNSVGAPAGGGGGVPSAALDAGIAYGSAMAVSTAATGILAALEVKVAAAAWASGGIPGIIVTAGFGLFDIFDAIFGGGSDTPMIPRQLLHNRHPLYTVILGVRDGLIPTEALAASKIGPNSPPSNEPPLGHIPGYNRPWLGYNYCGPSQFPGRPDPVDPTDACCQVHDDCYQNNGLSSSDVSVLHPGASAGPAQQACDQALCVCLGPTRSRGPSEHLLQGAAGYLFSCQ